jgi:hypothetical protein
MVNIKDKKCLEDDCQKYPIFNLPSEKTGLYCSVHKKNGMKDVMNAKCFEKNCEKRPHFNLPNESKPLFCKQHSTENMLDKTHKKCAGENCEIRPHFNLPNESKPLFCKIHSTENMEDKTHQRCIEQNCQTRPVFNYANQTKALYCKLHSKKDMQNVIDKKCISCNLFIVSKKTNFLCCYCDTNKIHHTKENVIQKLLIDNNYKFINNKQFTNDCCLKYRPDFLFDCNTYFVILEVDEFAHKDYPKDCEEIRMNNIAFGLGLPTKFIRYNPDKKGIKTKIKHKVLLETLNQVINKDFLQDLSSVYLYY